MKATVWKYNLVPGTNKIAFPRKPTVLTIGWQGMDLVMWVLLLGPDLDHQRIERRFLVVGTGEKFEMSSTDEYVGTAECGRNGIVVHVFEVNS